QGMFLVFNPDVTCTETTHISGTAVPLHGARGQGHMAFTVWEAELPAWRMRLADAAVAIETEIVWPGGGHSIYFRDPAGNSIELATPRLWGLEEGAVRTS